MPTFDQTSSPSPSIPSSLPDGNQFGAGRALVWWPGISSATMATPRTSRALLIPPCTGH